jgi:hypothetical protein
MLILKLNLSDLLKNTVDYHVDYNDIKKVLENMQNLAAVVNSSVHLKEDSN